MRRWIVTGLVCMATAMAYTAWSAADDAPKAAEHGAAVNLLDTYWKLVEAEGQPVAAVNLPEREPYMTLQNVDGEPRLVGYSGCNRVSGSYALDGDKVDFKGKVVMTLRACAQGMDAESRFAQALDEAVRWEVGGTTLRLYDAKGVMVARFEQRLL